MIRSTPPSILNGLVRKGVAEYGFEFVGFLDGWKGPLENLTTPLGVDQVRGILPRGGTPTAFDRWLATRFGLQAVTAVAEKDYGTMMALRGTDIVRVPLAGGTGELKLVPAEEYAEAEVFFG